MENTNHIIKAPAACKLEAGDYYWCACGHSNTQPFCDGSHKTRAPEKSPMKFTMEAEKEVWLCRCKSTGTPPYCDGTHKNL
jgi:CDGSH iron-sulfur domain-containing protein 3